MFNNVGTFSQKLLDNFMWEKIGKRDKTMFRLEILTGNLQYRTWHDAFERRNFYVNAYQPGRNKRAPNLSFHNIYGEIKFHCLYDFLFILNNN